ncbi:unnamed protein product [Triticum turgidum subsp. durum]|uniref:Uncharacterized protein n=1 Tax=Triticum turgidum subsp. durum TaxID=4567 RepID=A0A9R0SIX2_TRITD|nr:unnamed protein product [Triticum turgidum subsp. durum]
MTAESQTESHAKLTDANMAVMESANLDAAEKKVTTVENDGLSLMARQHTKQIKAVRKKVGRGWDPTYTRRSFFPHWRSVLQARLPLKVYPAYASSDPSPNHKLGPMPRTSPFTSNNQPRRSFVTAAIGAFRLLKVLK